MGGKKKGGNNNEENVNTKIKESGKQKQDKKAKNQEAQVQKQQEDKSWDVDSKNTKAAQKRNQDKELKKDEELKKKQEKAELKAIEDEELKNQKGVKYTKPVPITKYQAEQTMKALIKKDLEKKEEKDNKYAKLKYGQDDDDYEKDIDINWNHYYKGVESEMIEKYGEGGYTTGTGLDGALDGLTNIETNQKDIHPEKRMKAAWMAFQEQRMPEMKEEFPTLKRTQ